MAEAMHLDRGKFKELVVFLCAAAEQAEDDGFGMVKLNKLLYRSDFEAYRLLGHSITGETYEKQEFGPVARDLPIVLDELGAAGRLHFKLVPKGPHDRRVPALTGDPDAAADVSQFSPEERKIIETTLDELARHGGKSASDWSHEQSAGWQIARDFGETIDYATALISTEPISDDDLAAARDLARAEGWDEQG